MMRSHKKDGIHALIAAMAGPVLWFAHFSLVYAGQAYLCQSRADLVPAAYGTVTLLTLAGLTALAFRDWKTLQNKSPQTAAFLSSMRLSLTALAAIGVAWSAVGAVLLPPCA